MKNTMKRALSLLVVFAMVCVPMIASAAVGDGVAMPDVCIYSGEYVTVEAGATTYFEIGTGMTAGTYGFVVEGEGDFDVAVCTEGNGEYPYAEGEASILHRAHRNSFRVQTYPVRPWRVVPR